MNKSLLTERIFLLLFSLSIIGSRLFVFYFYKDLNLENEWANLFHNLQISGVIGFNVILDDNTVIQKFAEAGDKVLPSVWMPPFYLFFLHTVNFITGNIFQLTNSMIIIQILLNLLSIYIFFQIVRKFLNRKVTLYLTVIYAFFPALIFSSVQISSVSIQIFLILCFLYFIPDNFSQKRKYSLIIFSIFSGMLILTRGEFFIFYIFTLFYFFIFKDQKIKNLISSIIITLLVLSPYLYRNYKNFNTVVLTKSFGYNLLKGNNKNFKVEGDVSIINQIRENIDIQANNYFEIKIDNIYKDEAIKYIKENPLTFVKNYFKKFFSFLIIDINSSNNNYYHLVHVVPKLIISILALISALIGLKRKSFFQYLSLYYFFNILLFSFFFILPRYSVILIPIQLILIGLAFKVVRKE